MNAIFFDLDGTLLHLSRPYRDVLADGVREVTGTVDDRTLEAYEAAFRDHFGDCGPNPIRTAFAAADAGRDVDALAEALLAAEADACEPPENAAADLERLSSAYRLGVLTNGVLEWQTHKLRENGLAEHFDAVVASYEAGAHKPAIEPFRLAEERLPADAYAMVGDADADVDGARTAGWTARRYGGGGFGDLPSALGWDA